LVSRLLSQREAEGRVALSVEGLWAATTGGASVVGWEDRVESFEAGKELDAQLLQLDFVPQSEGEEDLGKGLGEGNVKAFRWESMQDRVAKWVYCGMRKVWVGKSVVHER
jgi:guanine deaminase